MLPDTEFVKMSDVVKLGFSKATLGKMIKSGALKRRILPGCRYGHFLRLDVERVLGMMEDAK